MNLSFLPLEILCQIENYDLDKLTEIRIRLNYPITVNYGGERITPVNNFRAKQSQIQYIIDNVTERSVYAYNNSIKQGFLTTKDGIRIGLCGECVFDKEGIITIKNFTSLNIRIPHFIKDCSKKIFPFVLQDKIYNSLIISPPARGKTTILKDLSVKLNDIDCGQILIIDERNEFSLVSGSNIDKIVYSDKQFAFDYALRSMSPEIVITDELCCDSDWKFVKSAVNSGVKVIASCHASTIQELKDKNFFIDGVFDRYIFLKNTCLPGILDCVYKGDFSLI